MMFHPAPLRFLWPACPAVALNDKAPIFFLPTYNPRDPVIPKRSEGSRSSFAVSSELQE